MKKFVSKVFLTAIFAVMGASHAHANVIYSQGFESGAGGYALSGLWHVTQNFPASGNNALGYVQGETNPGAIADGTYDTGSANSGIAVSPMISLPNGLDTLTFLAFNHNEFGDNPVFFDRLTVSVLSGSGSTLLASTGSVWDFAPTNIPFWDPSNQGYNLISIDISAFAGQSIQLMFGYDTFDRIDNQHPGARIDNVSISNSTAVPEPSSIALAGLGGLGLAFGAYRRRKSAAV